MPHFFSSCAAIFGDQLKLLSKIGPTFALQLLLSFFSLILILAFSYCNMVRILEATHLIHEDEPIQLFQTSLNNDVHFFAGSSRVTDALIKVDVWGENIEVTPSSHVEHRLTGFSEPILNIKPKIAQEKYLYNSKFSYNIISRVGKPNMAYQYTLPFQKGYTFGIQQAFFGITHRPETNSEYAVDFAMPENTVVCAARSGTIVAYRDDSSIGGSGEEFLKYGNYIYVRHEDNTYACYWHLKTNGVLVPLGSHVDAGQCIALSGKTGQAQYPHLHFDVLYKTIDGKLKSIPISFLTDKGLTTPTVGTFVRRQI